MELFKLHSNEVWDKELQSTAGTAKLDPTPFRLQTSTMKHHTRLLAAVA